MRLIDADALIKDVEQQIDFLYSFEIDELVECGRIIHNGIIQEVKMMPTIEAEPVRHGKWIWDEEGYHCSECWYHAQGNTMECIDGTFKFCPVCGARMEENEE